MRSSPSAIWLSRPHRDSPIASDHSNLPLTPTYIAPRIAPSPPPSASTTKSSFKGFHFQTVFRKSNPSRDPSLRSATSAHSASTTGSSTEKQTLHSFSAMPQAPLPVVSNRDVPDDEAECPVCLEPLSFSFRLPGEKPHIVPECGHALHEVRSSITLYLYELNSTRLVLLPFMGHHPIRVGPPFQENPT
jgi:hypothetical protein